MTLTTKQKALLEKLNAGGSDGMGVRERNLGKYRSLFQAGYAVRGPAPPRNAGGHAAYARRVYITPAGLAALVKEGK